MSEQPAIRKADFTCPHCSIHAAQYWMKLNHNTKEGVRDSDYWVSSCNRCNNVAIWYNDKMVYPISKTAPNPNEDLPSEIKEDFEEARDIVERSPRAACALLRLCIEKICNEQIRGSGDLNEKIKKLVGQGLDSRIQKSLDAVRVIGGEAIHPLTMDLKDNPNTAKSLFNIVNVIADWAYTQKKNIDSIYEDLPSEKKEAINKRDSVLKK